MAYIDLRSDTVTHPTQAMREAMLGAELGDDVYVDDPTTNELERRAAKLLGMEAALFVASGTMGNQLGILSWTGRGDEIIVGADSHIFLDEVGGPALLAGANMRTLHFPAGVPSAQMIEAAIRSDDIHEPRTALICLENALANGRVVTLQTMEEIRKLAKDYKLPIHLDGARLFNAATALGVSVADIAGKVDTLTFCLSKGLCAPIGAIFAGPRSIVARARKYRKLLGGGMRQTGVLAAAGLIAMEEMSKRLHIDHENAQYMAQKLNALPGVTVDMEAVEINMVFFTVRGTKKAPSTFRDAMLKQNIKINDPSGGVFRWVTHNGVSRGDIDVAVHALSELIE